MDFPYRAVEGWLGPGSDGKEGWAYVGFSKPPNLTNSNPRSGGYSSFSTRIRWSEAVETVDMTQKWGDRFLHFRDDSAVIAKMISEQTVLLELSWYGAGSVYFAFALIGSADAITRARTACRS